MSEQGKRHEVAIQDIWLMREGKDAVVYVKREGVWYEAIRESMEGHFSHCISSYGLLSAYCEPANWLNPYKPAQEEGAEGKEKERITPLFMQSSLG